MKTPSCLQVYWRPISDGCISYFFALLLSAILLPFQSYGQAPVNLVNLYDWTNVTANTGGQDPSGFVIIKSSTSAIFQGGLNGFNPIYPAIARALNTIPGAAYEISYTAEDLSESGPNVATLYFGNTSTQVDLPEHEFGSSAIPVNVDFTAMATSATTPMSFVFGTDIDNDQDYLYNLSVTEVPEVRTEKLLFVFGCALLYVRRWRRPNSQASRTPKI